MNVYDQFYLNNYSLLKGSNCCKLNMSQIFSCTAMDWLFQTRRKIIVSYNYFSSHSVGRWSVFVTIEHLLLCLAVSKCIINPEGPWMYLWINQTLHLGLNNFSSWFPIVCQTLHNRLSNNPIYMSKQYAI